MFTPSSWFEGSSCLVSGVDVPYCTVMPCWLEGTSCASYGPTRYRAGTPSLSSTKASDSHIFLKESRASRLAIEVNIGLRFNFPALIREWLYCEERDDII